MVLHLRSGVAREADGARPSFQCGCSTCEDDDCTEKPPWRKVLYVRQPYADNHTDAATFLQDMVMNADVSSPSYWPTVEASLVVAHEVATAAMLVAVFAFHHAGELTLDSLYALNASFLAGGLMLAALAENDIGRRGTHHSMESVSSGSNSSSTIERDEGNGERDGGEGRREPGEGDGQREEKGQAPSDSSSGKVQAQDPNASATEPRPGLSSSPHPIPSSLSHSSDGGTPSTDPSNSESTGQQNKTLPLLPLPTPRRLPPKRSPCSALRDWCSVVATCLLVALYLLLLSPIFLTLTRSVSSDTIWTSSFALLLLHLFLHDYSYSAALSSSFSSYFALLAALFACVLLASRLPAPENAFAFLAFGLQCFGLLPGILHRVALASERSHRVVVSLLLTLSVSLVCTLHRVAGLALVALLLFLVLVCPGILVHMHRSYKSTIHGPWDEAKLQKTLSH